MSKRIGFEEFLGVDQMHARTMARDPNLSPLWLRVMFAAAGWSNLIGHAEFPTDELAKVLRSDEVPPTRQVNKAIEVAREKGLIGEGSTRHCLLAPDWWDKAGGEGGKTCSFHNIRPRRRARQAGQNMSRKQDERDTICPAPGQNLSRSEAVTSTDAHALYESNLSAPTTQAPARGAA